MRSSPARKRFGGGFGNAPFLKKGVPNNSINLIAHWNETDSGSCGRSARASVVIFPARPRPSLLRLSAPTCSHSHQSQYFLRRVKNCPGSATRCGAPDALMRRVLILHDPAPMTFCRPFRPRLFFHNCSKARALGLKSGTRCFFAPTGLRNIAQGCPPLRRTTLGHRDPTHSTPKGLCRRAGTQPRWGRG